MENYVKLRRTTSVGGWLRRQLFVEKLNNPLGYVLLFLAAMVLGSAVAVLPPKLSVLAIGGMIGIPVVLGCIFNLHFGVLLCLTVAFFVDFLKKFSSAPFGTALDGLMLLLLFGLLARLIKERNLDFAKNPISLMIVAWIYYTLLQVINPWAASKMAWVFTVRSLALLLFIYFVAIYAFNSYRRIASAIKVVVGLAFLAALYSIKQEFIGYSASEMAWLLEDEKRYQLIFQWDRLRVFSFFSDPTTFGILMGYMGTFCFILCTGPFELWKKLLLGVAGVSMMMGMAFAGSRTPFVLVPLGVVFYTLMTLNRRTLLAFGFLALVGTAFVMKSTGNAVVWRIQSAFNPSDDASMDVRLENQKKIQPFIQQHPFGAGLGSTGEWGRRFTPDSWLASFAHDSLYVRLAAEAGWVGLLVYLALLFVAFWQGVRWFFRVKNPRIKVLYLGLTTNVFLLMVASYPQEAITILPTSIIFYISLAAITRLKDFDTPLLTTTPEQTS